MRSLFTASRAALFFVLSAAFAMNASALENSTTNPEAVKWFNKATQEQDVAKKIAAFKKATEVDPKFVEAFYNLGLLEKKQKNYVEALAHFKAAESIKKRRIKKETRVAILYELASMHKQLGNVAESIATLREAKASAKHREKRTQIIYELSRILHDEKRYVEALAEANEGQDLSPAYKNLFAKIVESSNREIMLQQLYAKALDAQTKQETESAFSLFVQVQQIDSTYRDVGQRIASLRTAVAQKDRANSNMTALKQAESYEQDGKFEMAIAIYENLKRTSSEPIVGLESRLNTARTELQRKKSAKEARSQYLAGEEALGKGDWIQAVIAFERVVKLEPDNKAAAKRLQKAQEALSEQGKKTQIIELYVEGMAAMQAEDYTRALTAFEKVRILDPAYKNTSQLISKIEQKITEQAFVSQTPVMTMPDNNAEADSLYQRALEQMAVENWRAAENTLSRLNGLVANKYDVSDLLATARIKVADERARLTANDVDDSESGSSIFVIIGVLAAVIVAPVVGAVTMSPVIRARFYLMAGKYAAAAAIYEGLLEKNPGRLKLYASLAKAYLLSNRNDAKAVEIYRKILQLNLVMPNREEIQSIVNQKYIGGVPSTDDAISVLENALSQEMKKDGNA